jgi:arginase
MMPRDVVLIGVPTNSGGTVDGVAGAPAVLRQRGLIAALASRPGFTDAGDLALPAPQPGRGPSGLLAEDALITMIGRVREAVSAARRSGRFPLLLGGDCPVILGALAALQAEQDQPGLLFVDGHEDAWPPRLSPTGEAADCELGLALRLFDADPAPRLRGVLPRIRARDVIAVGPRDGDELAAAGVPTLAGQLRALIRPAELAASGYAAAVCLPAPWWLHTDLDVLATTELAAVDYPQPGGLTWSQLSDITSAALAAEGCAGWSVCIYNPDLDPGRGGADNIITYITQAITTADHRLTDGAPDPGRLYVVTGGSRGAGRPGSGTGRCPARPASTACPPISEEVMTARIWTGATRAADADAYQEYMQEVALPGYANVTGNRAVLMLRRARDDDRTEFTMVTVWDGIDSVIAFTGPDPDRAVFYPRDERFLVERDLTVRHYDLYGDRGLARDHPQRD